MQINILAYFSAMVFDIYMKLNKYIKHVMGRSVEKCMTHQRSDNKYLKLKNFSI